MNFQQKKPFSTKKKTILVLLRVTLINIVIAMNFQMLKQADQLCAAHLGDIDGAGCERCGP
jgi:hypothetical protein